MKKRTVCSLLVVTAIFSLLQCIPAEAKTIRLYVPDGRAGNQPNNVYAFRMWSGNLSAQPWGNSVHYVDQQTGKFYLKVYQNWAWAYAYNEGHIIHQQADEDGSIHGDLFVTYLLRTGGQCDAELRVYDLTSGEVWIKADYDTVATGTWKSRVFDLGICSNDKGCAKQQSFRWRQNHHYKIRWHCHLYSGANATSEIKFDNSRIEHFILDAFSSDEAWTDFTGPEISVDPPVLPQLVDYSSMSSIRLDVNGTGWSSSTPIDITVDGVKYGDSPITNEGGNFTCSFNVPLPAEGIHFVNATDGTADATYILYRMKNSSPRGTTTLPCDITGAWGVPDGKIDIKDIAQIAKRFGWTDPNLPFRTIADNNGTLLGLGQLQSSTEPTNLAPETLTLTAVTTVLIAAPVFLRTRLKKRAKN